MKIKHILFGVIGGIITAGLSAGTALGLILIAQLIFGDSTLFARILTALVLVCNIVIAVYKEATQPDAEKTD